MRLNLLFILFSLFTINLNGQITVTNATFPAAGDTLKTVFDFMPANIEINPAGGVVGASWNFMGLQGMLNETVFRPASEGTAFDQFPSADLVNSLGIAGENYYRVTDNTFEFIGYNGEDPANLGLVLSVPVSPPIIERRAPLNFTDSYSDLAEIKVAVSADDIPGPLLDSLPVTPDSIRLRIEITKTGFIDGWGSMDIPGGTYDVLREKTIEIRDPKMDVLVGIWFELPDDIVSNFIGVDTVTMYNFYSEDSKERIAAVTVNNENNDQVQSVEYKYNDATTNVRYVNNGKPDILAYPNPAIESVRLEFLNLRSGTYKVKLYNILGVEVWQEDYSISGNHIAKVDISKLRKGTYLYSLINENGKTIATKRLVVMRP